MSRKSGNGKIIEFDPNKKRRFKSANYTDPAKKQLKAAREQKKIFKDNKYKAIQYTAFFIILCMVVYILKMSF